MDQHIHCDECNVFFKRARGEPCVCDECQKLNKNWPTWTSKQREDWLFEKFKALDRQIRNNLRLDVDVLKGLVSGMKQQEG